MPLLWLHGESDSTLKDQIDKIIAGGNGSFVIESRLHPDWLGEKWFADCKVIGDYAHSKGIKSWIFDEKWWPSFVANGRVPEDLRPKKLHCSAVDQTGPAECITSGNSGYNYIRTIAGKIIDGEIDATSLTDLASFISQGKLVWKVPEGSWKIMTFSWEFEGSTKQVDLASQESANWFINNVVKPHYDAMGEENINGFFFDEPQWMGDWGIGMENDTPRWKEMMVSQFFRLNGESQAKAVYTFWETLIERIGRVGFGTYRDYVNSGGGKLTGHFIEEDAWHNNGAGHTLRYGNGGVLNLMELEKYTNMPAMDLIGMYERMDDRGVKKNWSTYQLPKLISSVAITNNVPDHLAVILRNSMITSDFEVTSGEFGNWTHYNHRVRMGIDVFMIWNGSFEAKEFTARFTAKGIPEIWNPTTKTISLATFTRISDNLVDVNMNLSREESVLVVFNPNSRGN